MISQRSGLYNEHDNYMKKLINLIKADIRIRLIWCIQKMSRLFIKTIDTYMVFLPHGGMYSNGYDFFNYTSDNALSLLNYMVKRYKNYFTYRLGCDILQYESLRRKLKEYGRKTGIDIDCFPYYNNRAIFDIKMLKPMSKAKFLFMSEMYPLYTKKKNQKVVFLNYFIPFKEDYGYRNYPLQKMSNVIDYSFTTSMLSSYIISTVYNIPLSRCRVMGFSRNDSLLTTKPNKALEVYINNAVDYNVKHVLLYTPTHRDYEQKSKSKRDILGFKIDYDVLGKYLEEKSAVIICKIHSAQNTGAIDSRLPKGVLLHSATSEYGLCELLFKADCLITDYTSTYFDYLLLGRPVFFNFYDFDKYKETRGFSYDPIEPFIAGYAFTDEHSFFEVMNKYFDGIDDFAVQRQIIGDIQHKYKDSKSSERICDFLFGK